MRSKGFTDAVMSKSKCLHCGERETVTIEFKGTMDGAIVKEKYAALHAVDRALAKSHKRRCSARRSR